MSEKKINSTRQSTKRKPSTQQQQLQELFGFFENNKQEKTRHSSLRRKSLQNLKKTIKSTKKENDKKLYEYQNQYQNEENMIMYEGCYYDDNNCYYQEEANMEYKIEDRKYQQDQKDLQEKMNQHNNSQQSQKEGEKFQRRQSYSQPMAFNTYQAGNNPLKRVRDYGDIGNSNFYTQQIKNQRSLDALVSARKAPKKVVFNQQSNNISVSSQGSSNFTRNKTYFNNKVSQQSSNAGIQASAPIFVNPLKLSPFQQLNLHKFPKFYSLRTHQDLVKKLEELYKKMNIYGEKNFFKSSQNEEDLSEIFDLLGLKSPQKLGKAKACRELKALYKYLNFSANPQKSQQKQEEKSQVSVFQLKTGIELLDPTYVNQFKELMGVKKTDNLVNIEKDKNSLFNFGFRSQKKNR